MELPTRPEDSFANGSCRGHDARGLLRAGPGRGLATCRPRAKWCAALGILRPEVIRMKRKESKCLRVLIALSVAPSLTAARAQTPIPDVTPGSTQQDTTTQNCANGDVVGLPVVDAIDVHVYD